MIPWNQCPMLKLVCCYGIGILLNSNGFELPDPLLWLLLIAFALVIWKDKSLHHPKAEGGISLIIGLLFTCLGLMNASRIQPANSQEARSRFEPWNCQSITFAATALDLPKEYALRKQFQVAVWAIQTDSGLTPVQGKLLFNLAPSTTLPILFPGDTIYAAGYLTNFQSPYTSYRYYLNRKGIYYRAYIDTLTGGNESQNLLRWGNYFQQALVDQLKTVIGPGSEQEIALAMFLGYKRSLSPETREAFTIAGASHILSISGMHIGIIFLLLNYLLSFFHFLPQGKRIKNACILFLLLSYMLLTGLSPAVVRATLMFGLILLFRICFLRFHILNVVASAAMIQLLCAPNLLLEPGFQLSYTAVMGIILVFPWIERVSKTLGKGLISFTVG